MDARSSTGSINVKSQVDVLQKMSEGVRNASEARQFHIDELVELIGSDEREIQRSLYILEGHKYVSPMPAGDFTSKTWHITDFGITAIRSVGVSPRLFL
ncbi:MAG: hypothetical protein GX589_11325 [Deltaproteobacteria bacterium]|nr:hypothetical protein [Deltaproteobacteria bacterium]